MSCFTKISGVIGIFFVLLALKKAFANPGGIANLISRNYGTATLFFLIGYLLSYDMLKKMWKKKNNKFPPSKEGGF